MKLWQNIAEQFAPFVSEIQPLGNGLINDTYLVSTNGQPFVLQKINRQVFPNPALIMENLARLNDYVNSLDVDQVDLKIPELIKTGQQQYFVVDEHGDYWRAWSYLAGTDCLENLDDAGEACEVGAALGKFHRLCHDFDIKEFHDTLPGFHNTPHYFEHYRQAQAQTRVAENIECREFIETQHRMIHDLEIAKSQGLLTLRVTHGDPKLNNFLFDKHTRKVTSLIDLDTVKPGLIHYDIGDCLRSCCHDQRDDSFNMKICRAVLAGYVQEMKARLTKADYGYIYNSIRLIPFELGLRFYTDYLEGNKYFKVTEPEQNLHRAQAQFRLCRDIMKQELDIQAVIRN